MSAACCGEEPVFGAETTMPEAVREAKEAVWGMAAFALVYPVLMGLTRGADAAATAATQFCVAWALGLLVFGFIEGARSVRTLVMGFALLQAVVGWYAINDLETVPPLAGLAAAGYSLGASAAVLRLLSRPEAKAWFGARAPRPPDNDDWIATTG
ncbi:hypothetical protein ACL02S_03930 [Nocardia sp. 004]|uniref:hypothetical protein n=1 Tax=Nocardia sp. 004 TaxID=3385978 RepID=UPI0039A37D1E